MGGQPRAGAVEHAHHYLGVDEVFRAAQGDEAHCGGRGWGGFGHIFIVPGINFGCRAELCGLPQRYFLIRRAESKRAGVACF